MARGIWKGTLGFGLVSIGVELFAAEAPAELELSMLDERDHARIGYKKYNKATGEEIDGSHIVKGYEVTKGRYVILSPEDLKRANPHAAGSIDVLGFVTAGDIALAYFDTPYIVGPLKGSEKAYALLVQALEESGRVGLAQIVIRTKQHVAAVYPYQHALMVQLMRYDAELRKPSDFGIDTMDTPSARRPQELAMALQLVESMATAWEPDAFRDRYQEDVMRLIEARAAEPDGAGAVTPAAPSGPPTRMLDLMAALKGSLAARNGRAPGAKTAKKAAAKRAVSKGSTAKRAAGKRATTRKSA